jgi:murein DD-endopeptidase MepM/ murein hydrolase activator NlpD
MQLGPGRRSALTTIFAAALLGAAASAPAPAATGGAGLGSPTKRVTQKVSHASTPTLVPIPKMPQLAAAIALRHVSRKAASAATLRFVSHASSAQQVRIDVVRLADGYSVYDAVRTVAPETPQTVRWTGRASTGVALDGRYEFRLTVGDVAVSSTTTTPPSPGGAPPEPAPPPPGSAPVGAFTFVGAVFPVRGAHTFGEGEARFGAGRAGHVHEGQDVMADCGTPLVAARGGVVTMRARQWAAGNYLVIHDPLTGQDYMYAHLRRPAIVRRGAHVETGQPIGVVGETGDATACHLHFEIWTAPGWYAGGAPIDPLPTLKSWDRFS